MCTVAYCCEGFDPPPPARRERPLEAHHELLVRPTSACAERTTPRRPSRRATATHLCLRGENFCTSARASRMTDPPPPARRELQPGHAEVRRHRPTSASAERNWWDDRISSASSDLPLPARRERAQSEQRQGNPQPSPVCVRVEKTPVGQRCPAPRSTHLYPRRENSQYFPTTNTFGGLLPPARREHPPHRLRPRPGRPTSACAERRHVVRRHHQPGRPTSACAERTDTASCASAGGDLLPPARKGPQHGDEGLNERRTTSAHAERTRAATGTGRRSPTHLRLRGENKNLAFPDDESDDSPPLARREQRSGNRDVGCPRVTSARAERIARWRTA